MTNALNLVAPVDTLAYGVHPGVRRAGAGGVSRPRRADLVKQWLGPRGLEMDIEHWDFRTHGGYRYVHSDDNGEYRFNGTFHKVRDNEFIIQTFEFEGAPDMVNIEYMWFEDLGGGPHPAARPVHLPNTEARDALLSSGMEGGMTEGYALTSLKNF